MMAAALFLLLGIVGQPAADQPGLTPEAPQVTPEQAPSREAPAKASDAQEASDPAVESPAPDPDERLDAKAEQTWAGMLPDASLRKFAPPDGLILRSEALAALWEEWRPGEETPEIDFREDFVVVGTIDGPNRMFAGLTTDRRGNLKVVHGGTRVFGPGFGYVISRISREGVTTVNGKPLPRLERPAREGDRRRRPRPEGEFIGVRLQGTLETGVAAIGGETTGTVVRANGIEFELHFENERLARRAERLHGQIVIVTGPLKAREGVERGLRLIITPDTLAATIRAARPEAPAENPQPESAPAEQPSREPKPEEK